MTFIFIYLLVIVLLNTVFGLLVSDLVKPICYNEVINIKFETDLVSKKKYIDCTSLSPNSPSDSF